MTEDPNKIEVVVNDYSALNRGINEVSERATLATRLLAAQVWLEKVKVLFWAALVLGLLLITMSTTAHARFFDVTAENAYFDAIEFLTR